MVLHPLCSSLYPALFDSVGVQVNSEGIGLLSVHANTRVHVVCMCCGVLKGGCWGWGSMVGVYI